jgi:glycine betaine/proline transport system permease protein
MAICSYLPDLLCKFPAIDDTTIRMARKSVDDGFKALVREYVNIIDALVQPLQWFLNYLEKLFVSSPWFIVILAVMVAIVYYGSRDIRITHRHDPFPCFDRPLVGLWNDTMVTLAMVTVCTFIAIIVGLPIGILMARSDRAAERSSIRSST